MHILYLPLQTLFGAINAAARVVDQRAVEAEVTAPAGSQLGRGWGRPLGTKEIRYNNILLNYSGQVRDPN